jgi:hypothetical protein
MTCLLQVVPVPVPVPELRYNEWHTTWKNEPEENFPENNP